MLYAVSFESLNHFERLSVQAIRRKGQFGSDKPERHSSKK